MAKLFFKQKLIQFEFLEKVKCQKGMLSGVLNCGRHAFLGVPSCPETCVSGKQVDQVSGKSRSGRTCVLKVMSRLVIPENNGISVFSGSFKLLKIGLGYQPRPIFMLFQKIQIYQFCLKKKLAMRSRLLGFGPGGYPSHAYFTPHA